MRLYTLCYLRKGNQTLMIHRIKKQNDAHEWKWNWLWWKFEEGESPQECAIREVKEECWLVASNPLLKWIITFPWFYKEETAQVFVFIMNEFEGELINCTEGDLKWIDNDQILNLNLNDWDKYFLPLLDQKGVFCAKITYENWKAIDHKIDIY